MSPSLKRQVEGRSPVCSTTSSTKKKIDIHDRVGTPYLFEDWHGATLTIMGEEATFEDVKLDVLNNYVEVMINGAYKILDQEYFSSCQLFVSDTDTLHFVNGIHYQYNGKRLGGFIKETRIGDMSLMTRHKARIDKPGQDAKIVGQDTREKIIQSQEFYIKKGGKLYRVKNKKDVLEVLRRKEKKISSFMKRKKMNAKNEQDLIQILEHYYS